MNPREEQDLRVEIADAVEDKCLWRDINEQRREYH